MKIIFSFKDHYGLGTYFLNFKNKILTWVTPNSLSTQQEPSLFSPHYRRYPLTSCKNLLNPHEVNFLKLNLLQN